MRKYEADPSYGLLLTDFHMPEMDRFTLTAEIRQREAGSRRHLPIVALTADALPGTEQRCLEAGMDAYLTKPIDSKLLATALEKWLQAAALRQPAVRTTKSAAAPKIDPQIFDTNRLVETFGAVNTEALQFLAQFIGEARKIVAGLNAAMAGESWSDARHHAHALKGAGSSVGAVRLGQLSSDIQDCLDADDPDTASLFVGGLEATLEELVEAVQPLIATVQVET